MSEKERIAGREYLEKYFNAHIGRGSRRYHTAVPHEYRSMNPYEFFPGDRVDPHDSMVYIEESVDVSMRESDFQRLLDYIGYLQDQGYSSRDRYNKDIEQRVAFERILREKHPGVKKAYERYRILLDMVAQGKDIED